MAKPKAKVEGVYEKNPGSGVWYTRLRVNGKLVRKRIGSYKDAKEYIEKARTIRNTGAGIIPQTAKRPAMTLGELDRVGGSVTLGKLCDDWLRYIKAHPLEYKDQRNPPYRIGLIKEAFGDLPAGSIRPPQIADWLDEMAKDRAPATINRLKTTWSAIFRYGKERGHVETNPARDVKLRRVGGGVIRWLKPEEEARLRAVLQKAVDDCPSQKPGIRNRLLHHILEFDISIGTGMRKSEQYGLLWSDVDLEHKMITARDTKNGETRHIPMIKSVHAAFLQLDAMRLKRKNRSSKKPNQSPAESVFGLADNKKWWLAALKAAKIENYRWHDNRHTFCSRLAQKGASLKVIQEAAGHKTIQMSARYAHLHKSHLADAMSVLD
ncbi:tyrosine-type recombinase/integrase [Terriglobus aquaticus]|uniref:Tyrosine-type recombinase/integrase n=1 Tax=Terriglobus aquaticus TaxID=940139 RepID=A0ABW9KIW8_9BACT|nr:site-specific integrase [Terriglobus aquaticus]